MSTALPTRTSPKRIQQGFTSPSENLGKPRSGGFTTKRAERRTHVRMHSSEASAGSKPVRGFTLIELLVVIAIIGILSSVVLASLNTARSKGSDATIRSNLEGTRSQAELFNSVNNYSYLNVCTNTTVSNVKSIYTMVLAAATASSIATVSRNAAGTGTNAVCNDTAAGWAAQVPLKSTTNTWFCVDSNGYATTTTVTKIGGTTDVDCST